MNMMIIMIAMIMMSTCIIDFGRISLISVLHHLFPSGIIDLRLLHFTVLIFTVTFTDPGHAFINYDDHVSYYLNVIK